MVTRFDPTSRRAQDGAAATEFALVVPILILMLFGIVYFGLSISRQQVIESATRQAGRVAATGGNEVEVEAALLAAAPGFTTDEVTLVRPWDDCTDSRDTTRVVVRASGARLNFVVPFFDNGTAVTPTYEATAVFECETTTRPTGSP